MEPLPRIRAIAARTAPPAPVLIMAALCVAAGLSVAHLVSLAALSLPGIAMMLGLAALYTRFRDHPWVIGAMAGVRPAVVGLLAYTAWSLAPDGVRNVGAGIVALHSDLHDSPHCILQCDSL